VRYDIQLCSYVSLHVCRLQCRQCCSCGCQPWLRLKKHRDQTTQYLHSLSICYVQAAVPSVLQLWLPALAAAKQQLSLLQLVSSGEMLPAALAAKLLDALPHGCLLLNLYGESPLLQQCIHAGTTGTPATVQSLVG
jgi:hypothetical protein